MRASLVVALALLALCRAAPPAAPPRALPLAARAGLTGDPCASADDCVGGRACAPRNKLTTDTCGGREDCLCRVGDARRCARDADCDDGEICAASSSSSAGPACRSRAAVAADDAFRPVDEVPQASPSADNVCVAASALDHLPPAALVFARHPLARVLCDGAGSCATPGHIVVFDGHPMMMATYCSRTACTHAVIKVNSPRYNRAVRIPSRTRALHFTAFAARYQTAAEETLLAAAVRVGL